MRILAVDIGGLTQDILVFDTAQTVENCVKMVMPSPTFNLARKIREATLARRPIFFAGVNMGGGPSKRALTAHVKAGLRAYATAGAAATFDDDPDKVREMGVEIVSEDEAPKGADIERIETRDLDLGAMEGALAAFEVDYRFDAVAVAVLDHGAAPKGTSDRVFRFRHLRETVEHRRRLIDFAYLADEIPGYLTRMRSVAESLDRDGPLLVMDTPIAAAIGAAEDPEVARHPDRVVINVGNFHTLGFHLRNDTILGFFEHHTRLVDGPKIEDLTARMVRGELTCEEVFDDNGHGCFIMESAPEVPFVAITGPQRHLMRGAKFGTHMAAPFGDMMLTGCFGLVRAYAERMPAWREEIERALAS